MTPKQALQILDNVTALAPINRIDQQNTQVAIAVLGAYIDAHERPSQSPTPAANPNDEKGEVQGE